MPLTIPKTRILELLREFPDDVEVEEVIYRLYLLEKIAAAEEDIAAGRTLSAQEAGDEIAKWRS
ncbi:MAG: hypothetical protein HY720_11880 [Planctomycetes bacterium]|nr:hypothetical protein [Planctomycetota bacterium]